jgi:hypothetical protein
MYPVRASVHPQCSALTAGSETQKWRKSSVRKSPRFATRAATKLVWRARLAAGIALRPFLLTAAVRPHRDAKHAVDAPIAEGRIRRSARRRFAAFARNLDEFGLGAQP